MAYGHFTLEELFDKFQLVDVKRPLFSQVVPLNMSDWLEKTLQIGLATTLFTEKERSERIVSPVLFEIRERNHQTFSIYSGVLLEVDKEQGLNGECDFLLANHPDSYRLKAPIVALVG